MRDIIRALREVGKKVVEDRSRALKEGDYFAVAKAEEHIGLLQIATDRCEVLQQVMRPNDGM